MALNRLGRLDVVFSFQDASGPGIASARRGIGQFEAAAVGAATRTRNAFMGAFPALLTLNLIRGATRAFLGFLKPAADFETSMRKVATFANLGGQSFEEFEAVGKRTFQTISLITGKTAPDIAEAFTEMSKKGVDAQNALSSLNAVAKLSVVSNTSVTESAEVASTLFRVWGFQGKELEQRMNQLTIAAANSAINFDELGGLLTRSASGIFQAKPAFEDFLFLLSKTRDISASAAITGTQLRRAYEKFGESFDVIAGQLDVSTEDMQGNLRDISNTLFEAVTQGTRSSAEIQQIIRKEVGSRAAIPFTAIVGRIDQLMQRFGGNIEQVREEFFKLREGTQQSEAEIQRLFNTLARDNPQVLLDQLNTAWQFMVQQIGTMLLPSIGRFILQLRGMLIHIGNFFKKVQEAKKEVIAFGLSIDDIVDKVGPLFRIIGGGILILGGFQAMKALFKSVFNFLTKGLFDSMRATKALSGAQATNVGPANAAAAANNRLAASLGRVGTAGIAASRGVGAATAASTIAAAGGAAGAAGGAARGAAAAGAAGAAAGGAGFFGKLFGKLKGGPIGRAFGKVAAGPIGRIFGKVASSGLGRVIGAVAPRLLGFAGPIGLALSFAIPAILELTDVFGTSTADLEASLKETQGALGETADATRQLPDRIAGAFRAAQVEAEEVAKSPLPILQSELISKELPKAIEQAIARIDPIERAEFRASSEKQLGVLQKAFEEIIQARLKGEISDVESRTAFVDASTQLGVVLRGVGEATDNKKIREIGKRVFETSTGFAAVNEGLERQGELIGKVQKGEDTTTAGQRAFLEKVAPKGQANLGKALATTRRLVSAPGGGVGEEDFEAAQSRMLTDASSQTANNTGAIVRALSKPMPVELNTTQMMEAVSASFSAEGNRSQTPGENF